MPRLPVKGMSGGHKPKSPAAEIEEKKAFLSRKQAKHAFKDPRLIHAQLANVAKKGEGLVPLGEGLSAERVPHGDRPLVRLNHVRRFFGERTIIVTPEGEIIA